MVFKAEMLDEDSAVALVPGHFSCNWEIVEG